MKKLCHKGRYSINFQSILVTLIIVTFFTGCGGGSSEPDIITIEQTRTFKMGFTPWLYAATTDAQDRTYTRLIEHGDVIKHHLMSGIPWQEALEQTEYHSKVEDEISGLLNRTASSMDVFLAIDSLNTERDGIAPNWGESTNMELPSTWSERSWSSPEVISAYINFSLDMINRFQPTHFEYGTEVSELILNDPIGYAEYTVFSQAVYTAIKTVYPDLKLVTSVALKSPGSNNALIIEAAYSEIIEYTDVVGISIYPYVFFDHQDRGDPANLSTDWLTQINNVTNGKSILISETGWIGEDLSIPEFQYDESSDEAKQAAYIDLVLQASDDLDVDLIIWWSVTDFDTLWNDTLSQDPVAKIWKDIGLYDENQHARAGLSRWDSWFNLAFVED